MIYSSPRHRVFLLYLDIKCNFWVGPGLVIEPGPDNQQARTLTTRSPHLLTWDTKILFYRTQNESVK